MLYAADVRLEGSPLGPSVDLLVVRTGDGENDSPTSICAFRASDGSEVWCNPHNRFTEGWQTATPTIDTQAKVLYAVTAVTFSLSLSLSLSLIYLFIYQNRTRIDTHII